MRAAVILVLAYAVIAVTYSVANPPWEAPDEVAHYDFITSVIKTRALPVQRIGVPDEAQQTPLYYLIAAAVASPSDVDAPTGAFQLNPLFRWAGHGQQVNSDLHGSAETFPFQGQALTMHLARLVSVMFGLLTVVITIAIGWDVFSEDPLIGLLGGALVAFNPQFLFITSAINNDNLLNAAATGALWQTLRAIRHPGQLRQWVYVGGLVGVAILAKPSGVTVGGVPALALLIASRRQSSTSMFLKGASAMGLVVGVMTGWWFVRNQLLYGDPLGWTIFQRNYVSVLRPDPLKLGDVGDFFTSEFHSFWGVFGWMDVFPPDGYYLAVGALCIVGVLGFCWSCLSRVRFLSSFQKVAVLLLVVAFLVQELYLLLMIIRWDSSAFQGRYMFPAIAPAMLILSIGIRALLPRSIVPAGMALLGAALMGVAIVTPWLVIQPAYRVVPLPKPSLWFKPNSTDVVIGLTFALRNYAVWLDPTGSHLLVTLYWQAMKSPDFDYSVFVHLLDDKGQIVAQKDQGPGAAAEYPPTSWLPGDIIADEHAVDLPSQLPHGTYRLRVGVYNSSTGGQLPVTGTTSPPATFVILDEKVQR